MSLLPYLKFVPVSTKLIIVSSQLQQVLINEQMYSSRQLQPSLRWQQSTSAATSSTLANSHHSMSAATTAPARLDIQSPTDSQHSLPTFYHSFHPTYSTSFYLF